MKSFFFYLKRDLRLLLPLNLIFMVLIALGMGSVIILRINISRPLETIDFSVIAFLLFFLIIFCSLFITMEALWREWRLGTQYGWYLSQGSLHLKLWSKVIAVYLWQGFQLLITLVLFFTVARFASSQETLNELLRELQIPSSYLFELFWSGLIVPLLTIIVILFAGFLYFGLKTKWRFLYIGIYFFLTVILYPYIYFKIEQTPVETSEYPILMDILQIETSQILFDIFLSVVMYMLLYWFVKKKIEL